MVEEEEEEVGGQLSHSAGELCVVECVHLDLSTEDTESPLSLVAGVLGTGVMA